MFSSIEEDRKFDGSYFLNPVLIFRKKKHKAAAIAKSVARPQHNATVAIS